MLGTILKGPEDSVTFKSTCERPEIQDVNVFNSNMNKLNKYLIIKQAIILGNYYKDSMIF
jgi:hypothetical protein